MVVSLIIIVYIVISGELTGSGSQSVTWLECFNIITQHKYLWHQVWVEGKQGEHQNNLSQKKFWIFKMSIVDVCTFILSKFFFNIVIFVSPFQDKLIQQRSIEDSMRTFSYFSLTATDSIQDTKQRDNEFNSRTCKNIYERKFTLSPKWFFILCTGDRKFANQMWFSIVLLLHHQPPYLKSQN